MQARRRLRETLALASICWDGGAGTPTWMQRSQAGGRRYRPRSISACGASLRRLRAPNKTSCLSWRQHHTLNHSERQLSAKSGRSYRSLEEWMSKLKAAYNAILIGDLQTLSTLIREEPELVKASTPFGPLLHVAAGVGDEQALNLLVQHGAEIEARGGTYKGTALNYATSKGQLGAACFLLDRGAQLDVSEPECNPLFGAIYTGSLELVQLLVAHGIDVSVAYSGRSMKNTDALAFALERGQVGIADYLRICQRSK